MDYDVQVHAINYYITNFRLCAQNTYNLNEVAPAVAGFVQGDKCSFYQCNFLGVQDTLADYNGRHFFISCYIEGTTDFIFGDGTSIYQV